LLMVTLTECDPFSIATTSASACNYIYRKMFMPANSIAIIPKSGYHVNHRQSCDALCWLQFIEKERCIKLQRSGCVNEGKKKLGPTE